MRLAAPLGLAIALAAGWHAGADYYWPLKLPPELTSSFGEYRAGRYHAGIDLRTGGIGIPVYAAQDGYISRVRCSPYGYGKAVYVTFDDGNSAVYAHLDDFTDEVRAYVRRAQHAARSYIVDLHPGPGTFPVRRGELIARSGMTGVGAPHLHYELRDAAQRPVNPRLLGVNWPDAVRPELTRLYVALSGPGAAVNGDPAPRIFDLEPLGGGRYRCPPLRVSGRAAFAVQATDRGNSAQYRLGAWRYQVIVDDEVAFRVEMDRLDYAANHHGVVSFHPYLLDMGRFRVLWRWPGNASDPYRHGPGDGWIAVPAAPVPLRIEVEDFQGNRAVIETTLEPDGESEPPAPDSQGAASGSAHLQCHGAYLTVTAAFDGPEPEAPEAAIFGPGGGAPLTMRRVDERTFRAAAPASRTGKWQIRVNHPRMKPFEDSVLAVVSGEPYDGALGPLHLTASAAAPYGALHAKAVALESFRETPLPRLGPAYRVWPAETPINDPVTLRFPRPEGIERPERVHVYRAVGQGWRREDTAVRGGHVEIVTRRFGSYVILEDTIPPAVTNISPPDGYRAKTRRPVLSATITDVGSGIGAFEIYLGDRWLLTAYDPDHNKMAWERDEDLPSGPQVIVYRVTDAAGNETRVERRVAIP